MAAAGTTTDLYVEGADGKPQMLNTPPPTPPTDVPPPTKPHQPVQVRSHRMADEKPDGSIRDTSTEALRPGNDLGHRNLSDEEIKPPTPKPEEKPAEKPPEVAKPAEVKPPAEKVYAGKFKSAEDLEKSYQELEKKFTQTATEKATLERASLAKPAEPAAKTPQQIAAEQDEANKIVTEFVTDPKKFIQEKIVNQTMTALTAQQIKNEWAKANPDLAEHEIRVAFEATLLAQSDPELARDPVGLLTKATDNFRQFTGKIRTEGAKEALTQETRVIPLLSPSSTTTTEQPSNKAPLTSDDAFALHMKMLKEQEQKSHRGLRR
jgi:hypothetical protein